MTLIVLRCSGKIFCQISLNWDLFDVFSHDETGVMSFWEKDYKHKVAFSSHQATIDLFTIFIVLSFPECHVNGAIQSIAFVDLLL